MFRDASAELIDNAPALRYGIAVTDVDGDGAFEAVAARLGTGRYGFVVANYGGPFRLYELAEGRLVDEAAAAGIDRVTGGRGLLAGPLVSARMDIFAVNENGPNFLFVNQGDGSFSEEAQLRGLADADENGRGVAALDLDGDGRLDLAYGNWEGPHRLFLQDASGRFKDAAPTPLSQPSRVRTVLAADFDNDGVAELFFNNIGEANRLFQTLDR